MINPAILQLLRFQSQAKLRRIGRCFTSRRRALLTTLGTLLAIAWLGNAIASVVLREPMDPAALQVNVPLILFCYGLWHVVRTFCWKPDDGIEWTPAEQELVVGGPFCRFDQLAYRLTQIASSALLKAALFTFLMSPDIPLLPVGFIGALLALSFLDIFRILVQLAACGITDGAYLRARVYVVIVGAFAAATCIYTAYVSPRYAAVQNPDLFTFPQLVLHYAMELRETPVLQLFGYPFEVYGQVILAESLSWQTTFLLAIAAAQVIVAAASVIAVDRHFSQVRQRREQRKVLAARRKQSLSPAVPAGESLALPAISRWLGAGTLAWRQGIGVRRHLGGLVIALLTPSVLASLPLLVNATPFETFLNVAGALGFYTLLLLPTALKFDFRRDVDVLPVLKTLPVSNLSVICGQLTMPVLIATLYQAAVLLSVTWLRAVPLNYSLVVLLLFIPLNILIFAAENVLFLWYPHRLNQEGFDIFLRTTLTFTAKGIVFGGCLAGLVAWGILARLIATVVPVSQQLLFLGGLFLALLAGSLAACTLLTRAYSAFDPSQDMPG